MRTFELEYPHALVFNELPETVTAIGFFDGIHCGHQRVIQTAVSEAKNRNMESAVITFFPHPSVVLKKDAQHVKYITPLREKKEILKRLGVDRLYIIKFNKELASLSPQGFIDHFIKGLNIKHVVAGFDFSYGHKGKGNMETIKEHAADAFSYTTISKVELDNEKISSTRIRECLKKGQIEKANELLGRPLIVDGIVIKGEQRGKALGYPTANIDTNRDALLPKTGVYAVKIIYKNERYEGMASLGVNPTFTPDLLEPVLEVNIFDYNNDLYGDELLVEFHAFIREEQKFAGAAQLIKKIAEDEVKIRNYFTKNC
ncbi:bifunctional riboflavin kinase/FAD synthetase [Virgibacillus sp. AGTR]|uniref:bifunctional riboflavin kinase/FAD synthetase n=1 Tax=Virgibacillus sp. AGTR TaxID=2812055 RepID=UPI001965DDF1|nr:bifunctional riboflavin kinase/FAD synthetase [Virgibacillus sp. AGTR]MCC2249237.1 bifunctional riboflavin kinase/FAD synthetase [Virgibacillus sp. AGTR]QRZ17275.1 bifunctional riboflavin kinase/FAD synthetase [Virgibacillus sp. AGTR]